MRSGKNSEITRSGDLHLFQSDDITPFSLVFADQFAICRPKVLPLREYKCVPCLEEEKLAHRRKKERATKAKGKINIFAGFIKRPHLVVGGH